MLNTALKNMLTRTSVRQFLAKEVEQEKIDYIVKCALAAPTACNKQPWEFIIINDKDKLAQLSAKLPFAQFTKEANFAIVVCGNMDKTMDGKDAEYWIQDCSSASLSILLAAHAQKLGACWTAAYPHEDRMTPIREILNLPENIIPLNLIPIGYPENLNSMLKVNLDSSAIHNDTW